LLILSLIALLLRRLDRSQLFDTLLPFRRADAKAPHFAAKWGPLRLLTLSAEPR
jgi:hypothetical protein